MARTPGTSPPPSPTRRQRGFEPASGLLKDRIRTASESRGFAMSRILTHWPEVAGEALARITRPVKMGYGREGMGATLTLLTAAAHAPMVQMQLPALREKVNGVYGYNAISRIVLTQTSAVGFAEGQADFTHAPRPEPPPDPALLAEAARTAAPVRDEGLRNALEMLAQNVLKRRKPTEGSQNGS